MDGWVVRQAGTNRWELGHARHGTQPPLAYTVASVELPHGDHHRVQEWAETIMAEAGAVVLEWAGSHAGMGGTVAYFAMLSRDARAAP